MSNAKFTCASTTAISNKAEKDLWDPFPSTAGLFLAATVQILNLMYDLKSAIVYFCVSAHH